jgi:hypothetical protein
MRTACLLLILCAFLVGAPAPAYAETGLSQGDFYPLTVGSEWIYSVYLSVQGTTVRFDTVRVDDATWVAGKKYYHLTTPWFPVFSIWVSPGADGNLYWCDSPGTDFDPLILFSAEPGEGWLMNRGLCTDSVAAIQSAIPTATPSGDFTDVRSVRSRWRSGDCTDVLWEGTFANGTGPVQWIMTGVGGASIVWELAEYLPATNAECDCHADPVCDSECDILDVVAVVAIAFRGGEQLNDIDCSYYPGELAGRTDVNCSGATDIMDVIYTVDVAFRGGDPQIRFCKP